MQMRAGVFMTVLLCLPGWLLGQQRGAETRPALRRVQDSADAAGERSTEANKRDGPDVWDAVFRAVALEVMPRSWEDTDDWGKQKRFTTGLRVWRDGLRIKTKRRRKDLNHGTWRRYSARLAQPKEFQLQVSDFRPAGDGHVAFDLAVTAPLRVSARQARWQRGVQLYSVHADVDAKMRLRLSCQTAVQLNTASLPPEVRLYPLVDDAQLRLVDFRLVRVSKVGGEIAAELGRAIDGRIERRIAAEDKQLTRKINDRLAARDEGIRLSLAALAGNNVRKLSELLQSASAERNRAAGAE